MEIFLVLVGLWIFFSVKARKQKKEIKHQVKAHEKQVEATQRDYDDYMLSLPELKGAETFEIELFGSDRFSETLDLYADWLLRNHPDTRQIWVIVDRDDEHEFDPNAVKVEAGMTTFGFVPRDRSKMFCDFIDDHGPVKTSAKFQIDPYGTNHRVFLDASFPLKLKN
jgi:hypothetical protein